MSWLSALIDELLQDHRPQWKINLERCNPDVFYELGMSREEVEEILEVLDEYGLFANMNNRKKY